MIEPTQAEAVDYILDCYNAMKELAKIDNTIWEPVRVSGPDIFSMIDGRRMTQEEFLKQWPSGTWPDIRKSS